MDLITRCYCNAKDVHKSRDYVGLVFYQITDNYLSYHTYQIDKDILT